MSDVDFPYHVDPQGRTARTDRDDHVRDLIEQVLFTSPGERVNRPTFGAGLRQLVFAPLGDELATSTQFLIQGALQQWVGDAVNVEDVSAEADDGALRVTVRYTVKRSGERRVDRFTAPPGLSPEGTGPGL